MQTVVTALEMRWCDESTIRSFGVPGLLLMDRAGTGAAHLLLTRFSPLADRPVTIVCGSGNNAGDGFVVARVLANHQVPVRVILCTPASRIKGDAATQFRMLQREARSHAVRISVVPLRSVVSVDDAPAVLIVDAVFGTGFTGRPRGAHARAIEWMNAQQVPIASLDIPSGVDATTGRSEGTAVRAAVTITFGHVKTGLLLNDGRALAGHVTCIGIGIPSAVSADVRLKTRMVEPADVRTALPRLRHDLHKYSAGKVLVVAGSRGYTGAAVLATMGALRSGAGAVVLAHPDAVHQILARKLTEPILLPLPSDDDGGFTEKLSEALMERLAWADALLIGPGIGRSSQTAGFLAALVGAYGGPAILDADALALLPAVHPKRFRGNDWIVTPHAGEFARLSGGPVADVEHHRIDAARNFARQSGWTTVLKGSPTCTADPDGIVTINTTGNPGMATVGSGDVLAGLIAGFRAQGIPTDMSAWAGVYVHGRAGDIARDRLGERSMLASDILDSIPLSLRELK